LANCLENSLKLLIDELRQGKETSDRAKKNHSLHLDIKQFAEFKKLCAEQNLSASYVVDRLIGLYIAESRARD